MENTTAPYGMKLEVAPKLSSTAERQSASQLALEMARADREKVKADWEKKTKGIRDFGNKLGEIWDKSAAYVKHPEVREAYAVEAQEKHDRNVAERNAKLAELRDRVVGTIDKYGNAALNAINETVDYVSKETVKAGKI